jgi:hypothetical protein
MEPIQEVDCSLLGHKVTELVSFSLEKSLFYFIFELFNCSIFLAEHAVYSGKWHAFLGISDRQLFLSSSMDPQSRSRKGSFRGKAPKQLVAAKFFRGRPLFSLSLPLSQFLVAFTASENS